jgi:outer membrane protein assembly factor BamD (BamD/ComL family)
MKKWIFLLAIMVTGLMFVPNVAMAQGAKQGPDVMRDPDMEKESLHNLEVAKQYFTLRKAYVAALQRCEEVLAGNPEFSRIDEILFYAGQSSLNLAEGKGKQKSGQYVIHEGDKKVTLSAAEFREKARDYLSQLVNNYPQSKLKDVALENLKALGGPRVKEAKP